MKRLVVSKLRRRVSSPTAQLLSAFAGMIAGAWLIGLWMVGIVLMVSSGLWAADALLRSVPERRDYSKHESILERYRRAA